MEIHQIRYFVSVAQELNFTRAAESCRVAQPSLSQQIQKLEVELGGPLFHRLGRRIRLTDLGEALMPRAERILQLHKETLHEANEHAEGGGSVSFGAILTIAPFLLHLIAEKTASDSIYSAMEAHEDFTENLLRKLKDGVLDFAVMSTPIEEPCMLCRVLAKEPFVAVLPEKHPLLRKTRLQLSELLEQPFLPLSYVHCAGKQINELCRIGGKSPKSAMQCTQIETILKVVEQGAGVTILPRMALARLEGKRLAFRKLEGRSPTREIALVHHQDRYLSPSARKLIKTVEQAVQQICAN
ncbi:MAG: LysR family transcriptional regulator [Verrucomicrobiota bacterium]